MSDKRPLQAPDILPGQEVRESEFQRGGSPVFRSGLVVSCSAAVRARLSKPTHLRCRRTMAERAPGQGMTAIRVVCSLGVARDLS